MIENHCVWESAKVVLGEENLKLGINVRISRERSERKIFWTLFASEASEKLFFLGGGVDPISWVGGRVPFRGEGASSAEPAETLTCFEFCLLSLNPLVFVGF